jgi:hypothetical protein
MKMSRYALHLMVTTSGLFCLSTVGQAAPPASSDRPSATETVRRGPALQRQLPPDVQQDPAARVMRLQQLRAQIVARIKGLGEGRYRQVVRPSLDGQLRRLGFDDQDVTYFLTDLDRTRGPRR